MASKERQRTRRKSNRAADFAAAGVLDLILSLPMPEETRGPLATAALAMVLASGRERVLQATMLNHPESQPLIVAAMRVLDEQLAEDPEHFLHAVVGEPGGGDGDDHEPAATGPVG